MTRPMVSLATSLIFSEIAAERNRQDGIWGEQNHPDGTGPDVDAGPPFHRYANSWGNLAAEARRVCQRDAERNEVTWLGIAREEVFESFAEDDPVRLRAELIQAAAVFAAWVEAIDRRQKGDPAPTIGGEPPCATGPGASSNVGTTGPGSTALHPVEPGRGVLYVLWSNKHQMWWRPNASGYTHDLAEAGRYSEADALARVLQSSFHGDLAKVTCMVVDTSGRQPAWDAIANREPAPDDEAWQRWEAGGESDVSRPVFHGEAASHPDDRARGPQ